MKKKFGKGIKACKHCGEPVKGARTMTCPHCNGDLKKAHKAVVGGQEVVETPGVRKVFCLPDGFDYPSGGLCLRIVGVPMGDSPIRLTHSADGNFPDISTIADWAMEVREKELKVGRYITNEGLLFWARQQLNGDLRYNNKGPEITELRELIKGLPDIYIKEIPVV